MTDKAIEIAEKIYQACRFQRHSVAVDIIADIIRPYLAPEYKYAQVPCSEHIKTDGFTEAKLQPRKPYGAIGISVGEELL